MSDYNGWTNYETWVVKLWIDNDQGSQDYWLDEARLMLAEDYQPRYDGEVVEAERRAVHALAETLKDQHEENYQDLCGQVVGVYSDLMSHALAGVNWIEVAESLIEEVKG